MKREAVGIDVSKASLAVSRYDGQRYERMELANNRKGHQQLVAWLGRQRGNGVAIGIEATGPYGEKLVDFLHERGYPVAVINPARVKAYAQSQLRRSKTDKLDSDIIAHFMHTQPVRWYQPQPAEQRQLRALSRRVTSLKGQATQEKNRLHVAAKGSVIYQDISAHLAYLQDAITRLEEEMDRLIRQQPYLAKQRALLLTIAGVGQRTATQFLAEVPDIGHFHTAAQLVGHAGLNACLYQSGSSRNRQGGISKLGYARLRTMLYMPAAVAQRYNPVVKAFADRLAAKGKHKLVIRVAAMRKLLLIMFGVLKSGQPFDPNYATASAKAA